MKKLFSCSVLCLALLTGCELRVVSSHEFGESLGTQEVYMFSTDESAISVESSDGYREELIPELTPLDEQDGLLTVHFLDVGQGDSIFIELPNDETMLIDAAEKGYGDDISEYITNEGYTTLDYVVATHGHSDHIGGMVTIFDTFEVENFYTSPMHHTSQTYENMFNAAYIEEAEIYQPISGDIILEEGILKIEVVSPQSKECEDQNNASLVLKLTYGDVKFLFTGDIEKQAEDDIWTNIKCDVLKVGHHGSNTSSSANFIKKVEPKYAVISCGVDNKYDHPHQEVVDRLLDSGAMLFRTDLQKNVVFVSDGKAIDVSFGQ